MVLFKSYSKSYTYSRKRTIYMYITRIDSTVAHERIASSYYRAYEQRQHNNVTTFKKVFKEKLIFEKNSSPRILRSTDDDARYAACANAHQQQRSAAVRQTVHEDNGSS